MVLLIILLVIWEIYWTYKACWIAAKRGDKKWFLFFLIFNLLGIPEIIYVRSHRDELNIEDNRKWRSICWQHYWKKKIL